MAVTSQVRLTQSLELKPQAARPSPAGREGSLGSKLREAASHTIIYGLGAALQSLLGFVLIPLYTKYYTTEVYGVLSLLVLCGTLAGVVFYLGASSALSRSYYDYDDPIERKKAISTSLYLTLGGALVQIILGFLLGEKLSMLLFDTPRYALHIRIVLASSAVAFLNGLFYLILRFERKSKQVICLNLASLVVGASLILFLLTVAKIGVMAPILGEAINQTFTCIVLLCLTRKCYVLAYSRKELVLQLRYGLPNVLSGLLYYLMMYTDRLWIDKYSSLSEVGIYSLGYKLGMTIHLLFIIPFAQIWAPMRMQYRSHANANDLSRVVLTYYFCIGMLFALTLSIFSKELLAVLARREEYRIAYQIVPLILMAHLIYGGVNIIDFGIALARKPLLHCYGFSAALALNMLLNWLWVPLYGYRASAVVALITFLVLLILVFRISNRLYPVPWEPGRLLMVFASAMAVLAFGFLCNSYAPPTAMLGKAGLLLALVILWLRFLLTSRERNGLVTAWQRLSQLLIPTRHARPRSK